MVGVPRAALWVPVVHHGLGRPVLAHAGGGVLPVGHLEHGLEHLQVALEGPAPEPTEGAELVKGIGEVDCGMKLRFLEAAVLPLRHLVEGLEEGVVQLGERSPWV